MPDLDYGWIRRSEDADLRGALTLRQAACESWERLVCMVLCPKCGNETGQMDSFCRRCGTQVLGKCESCKESVGVNDMFCGKCGTKNKMYQIRQASSNHE